MDRHEMNATLSIIDAHRERGGVHAIHHIEGDLCEVQRVLHSEE